MLFRNVMFIGSILLLLSYYLLYHTTKSCCKVVRSSDVIEDLSKKLTNAMKRIGQLTCDKSSKDVSESGGWCSNLSGANSTKHYTDNILAITLSKFLKGKTVASFGDGPGIYKQLIDEKREVKFYDAFDGAPYCEETTDGRVKFLDLSVPIYHLKQYEWIISLEVAEHISQEYESIYLDNLARHSLEGIILSWAKIGQLGHSHVNNRNFDYVKRKIEERGYRFDHVATRLIKDGANFPWIKNNVNVFVRLKDLN